MHKGHAKLITFLFLPKPIILFIKFCLTSWKMWITNYLNMQELVIENINQEE